jgi:hypothetical protein
MKINVALLILSIFLFSNCVTTNTNTLSNNPQRTNNKSRDVIAYILASGENLSTFIETQNSINEYAKHDIEPTDDFYRELFLEYSDYMKEGSEEFFKDLTEEDIKELQEDGLTVNDVLDLFSNISFFYIIEYNRNTKVWYLELIGRSTTLVIEFANTRKEGMRFAHNVIPYINRWMDLNNIPSVDNVLRIYLNDVDDDIIPELFGIRLE